MEVRHSTSFLGLEPPLTDLEGSEVVLLPVPFERTTSYGKGTAGGPAALLEASQFVELYDEELDHDLDDHRVATLPPFLPRSSDLAGALAEIEEAAAEHLKADRFLVTLGGEHSLSIAPIRAARRHLAERGEELGVLQFDAHADLRDSYEGTPHSHACVMRRVHDLGLPIAAVGLRALSRPEGDLIRRERLPVIWGHELDTLDDHFDALLAALPDSVYLTFDIDYFDPSLVPATGTPEPGGGFWNPTLRCLRKLFASKRVVAMDVVELAPHPGSAASDFVAAKLVAKCLTFRRVGQDAAIGPQDPPSGLDGAPRNG